MQKPRKPVQRRLVRKARVGSAPKKTVIIGTGQRWTKPYRKPGELERHRAAAWARVEATK